MTSSDGMIFVGGINERQNFLILIESEITELDV